MGWLDANEYFLMQAAARDRLDDVRLTADLAAPAGDAALDGASPAEPDAERARAWAGGANPPAASCRRNGRRNFTMVLERGSR